MSTYLSILHLGIFSPSISEHFDVAYQKQIAELKDRMTSLSMEPEIWVNLVDPGLVNTRSLQAYLILAIFSNVSVYLPTPTKELAKLSSS